MTLSVQFHQVDYIRNAWRQFYGTTRHQIADDIGRRPLRTSLATFNAAAHAAFCARTAPERMTRLLNGVFFDPAHQKLNQFHTDLRRALELDGPHPLLPADLLVYGMMKMASYWFLMNTEANKLDYVANNEKMLGYRGPRKKPTLGVSGVVRSAAHHLFTWAKPRIVHDFSYSSGSHVTEAEKRFLKRLNIFGESSDYFKAAFDTETWRQAGIDIKELANKIDVTRFDRTQWRQTRDFMSSIIGARAEQDICGYVEGLIGNGVPPIGPENFINKGTIDFVLQIYEPKKGDGILIAIVEDRIGKYRRDAFAREAADELRLIIDTCRSDPQPGNSNSFLIELKVT